MSLPKVNILTYIGLTVARERNHIIADMLPDGMDDMADETEEGIRTACVGYTKIPNTGRFTVSRPVLKRLISLMHWAKDKRRLGEDCEFPAGTTREELRNEITQANIRHECRKAQRKIGESILTDKLTTPLKLSSSWERWNVEFHAALGGIIGAKGIPLLYVVRDDTSPAIAQYTSWESKAIAVATHTGLEFKMDSEVVHNIILKNISQDSDAYTYIKPHLKLKNGRSDILALRDRFENKGMLQERINQAEATLKRLVYRDEHILNV